MRMSVRIRTFVSERADPQTWVRGPILPKCRGWAFGRPWFRRPGRDRGNTHRLPAVKLAVSSTKAEAADRVGEASASPKRGLPAPGTEPRPAAH